MLTTIINKHLEEQNMNLTMPKSTAPGLATLGKYLVQILSIFCLLSTMATAKTTPAENPQGNSIQSIEYATLPGNRLQISLAMSEEAVNPLSFTIDNPARIAFDFNETGSSLPKRSQPIGIGIAQSITTISTKTKTRVILNLSEVVPYQVTTQGKNVLITLDSESTGAAFDEPAAGEVGMAGATEDTLRFSDKERGIDNIDFRRGEEWRRPCHHQPYRIQYPDGYQRRIWQGHRKIPWHKTAGSTAPDSRRAGFCNTGQIHQQF